MICFEPCLNVKTILHRQERNRPMRLAGKVAIVAGAAWGGIGSATAFRLAQEGAKVVVNTRRRADELQRTIEEIVAIGGEAVAVMGDVADENTWQALVSTAIDRFGSLSTLV